MQPAGFWWWCSLYIAIIESILSSSVTIWYAAATAKDKSRLQCRGSLAAIYRPPHDLYTSGSLRPAVKVVAALLVPSLEGSWGQMCECFSLNFYIVWNWQRDLALWIHAPSIKTCPNLYMVNSQVQLSNFRLQKAEGRRKQKWHLLTTCHNLSSQCVLWFLIIKTSSLSSYKILLFQLSYILLWSCHHSNVNCLPTLAILI